ncbi:hypothetical protein GEMRC1_001910 [Eukaryota sp. GEM-RC1]
MSFSDYLEAVALAADELESPLQTRAATKSSFASIDNLDTCIAFINSSLSSLNLPSPLCFYNSSSSDVVHTVNAIYGLLQMRQTELSKSEELSSRITKLSSDRNTLETAKRLVERDLTTFKSKLGQSEEVNRRLKNELSFLERRAASDREAYNRTVSNLEHRDSQFQHQIKKLELRNNKLQARLDTLLRNPSTKPVESVSFSRNLFDPANVENGHDTPRKRWDEIEGLKMESFEERNLQLMDENAELRRLLKDVRNSADKSTWQGSEITSTQQIYDLPLKVGKSPIKRDLHHALGYQSNVIDDVDVKDVALSLLQKLEYTDRSNSNSTLLNSLKGFLNSESVTSSHNYTDVLEHMKQREDYDKQQAEFSRVLDTQKKISIASPGFNLSPTSSPLKELESCLDQEF